MDKFSKFLLVIFLPFIILMFFVNLLMSNAFLKFEYNAPWFPTDPYGFSIDDRIEFGSATIQYLITDQGRVALDELKSDDGKPLYIQREVDHLVDVKNVMVQLNNVYLILVAASAGLISLSLIKKDQKWKAAVRAGAMFTLILLVSIGVFAATSFWTFFEKFHAIFFKGDSWLFYTTDVIIRLFPLRLWQDAVMYLVSAVIIASGLILATVKPKP